MSGEPDGFGSNEAGGSTAECPLRKQAHWLEIVLVGEDGQPLGGVAYRATLPDGETVLEGTLGADGRARIDGLAAAGACSVTFHELDGDAWALESAP